MSEFGFVRFKDFGDFVYLLILKSINLTNPNSDDRIDFDKINRIFPIIIIVFFLDDAKLRQYWVSFVNYTSTKFIKFHPVFFLKTIDLILVESDFL